MDTHVCSAVARYRGHAYMIANQKIQLLQHAWQPATPVLQLPVLPADDLCLPILLSCSAEQIEAAKFLEQLAARVEGIYKVPKNAHSGSPCI